ncbi:hypothetical protein BH20ACT15_BH20ACT15_12370 [soil metagenome]
MADGSAGDASLGGDAPILGGQVTAEAGAEEAVAEPERRYDPRADAYTRPSLPAPAESDEGEDLGPVPPPDPGRLVDDWGRSERLVGAIEPILDFYYRRWFRVEHEGIENVPSSGGALLVSNHSGALPPDAPMIMTAIRRGHPSPRPLYMLAEHWFKGYPGVGMLVNKMGAVPAHRENAQRLLRDEGKLAIVFPEGQKGTRKVLWQRYKLRRFGRGGFVRTAIRARVPIVPIAVVGAEEAMPIFAHMRSVQRLTGLVYAPLNHAFPWFGPLAGAMYLPAKFRIRFCKPIDMSAYPLEVMDDAAEVQMISERIRAGIATELEEMLEQRDSVWLG